MTELQFDPGRVGDIVAYSKFLGQERLERRKLICAAVWDCTAIEYTQRR